MNGDPEVPNSGLTTFQRTPHLDDLGRTTSSLRVYCDSGKHWLLREDDPNFPPLNSQRSPNNQEFEDLENMMVSVGGTCSDPTYRMETSARGELEIADDETPQSEIRPIVDVGAPLPLPSVH